MAQYRISAEAHWGIVARPEPGRDVERGRENGDGTFTIELEDDTVVAINRHRLGGESLSDVIVRVLATSEGRKAH